MDASWLIPDAVVGGADGKGLGLFATAQIPAGTTVAGFGGHVVDRAAFDRLDEEWRAHSLQIDDDLYLVSVPPYAPADHMNHSCEPNCGIVGSCVVVAIEDIRPGDELCFDYAMTDTDDYDEFVCSCATVSCRGVITGGDWKRPELQARYAGMFSSYIERKIAQATASER